MKSPLGKLQDKFNKSGLNGNPVISTPELKKLKIGLAEVADFMQDRGDKTMSFALRMEVESVERMIYYRLPEKSK